MSFRIPPTSKYVQMATTGRATGVWDQWEHTFYFQLPPGITKGYMEFSGIPGYYEFDFDTVQCSWSYVNWGDYDFDYESATGFSLKENFQGGVDCMTKHYQPPVLQVVIHIGTLQPHKTLDSAWTKAPALTPT